MKLFEFNIVKMPQENAIFVTKNGYLYYIYNSTKKVWSKYYNQGNDVIKVENYQEVTSKELASSFDGIFPKKRTAFIKACSPYEWSDNDVWNMLYEEFPSYMDNWEINNMVNHFLSRAFVFDVPYRKFKELFENAKKNDSSDEIVISKIKELSISILGKNIFCNEIEIIDELRGSSFFKIRPSRIIAPPSFNRAEISADMTSCGISIDEEDIFDYLSCFLYKHFDEKLDANKNRCNSNDGFDWYNDNYFTLGSIKEIIDEINDTANILALGKSNEFTSKIKMDMHKKEEVIDFYQRFSYRMEYMVRIGRENGFDLISFTGP